MAKVVIDQSGNKIYYNDNRDYHREDGPAIIFHWGLKKWYINGKQGGIDRPDAELPSGIFHWHLNGKFHRENGPSLDHPNGYKQWSKNGWTIWPNL